MEQKTVSQQVAPAALLRAGIEAKEISILANEVLIGDR